MVAPVFGLGEGRLLAALELKSGSCALLQAGSSTAVLMRVVRIVGDHASRVEAAWNSSSTARASRRATCTGDPLVHPSPPELVSKEFWDV